MGWYEDFQAMLNTENQQQPTPSTNSPASAGGGGRDYSDLMGHATRGGADTETLLGTANKDWYTDLIESTRDRATEWENARQDSRAARDAIEKAEQTRRAIEQRQAEMDKQLADMRSSQVDPNRMAMAMERGWNGVDDLNQFEVRHMRADPGYELAASQKGFGLAQRPTTQSVYNNALKAQMSGQPMTAQDVYNQLLQAQKMGGGYAL